MNTFKKSLLALALLCCAASAHAGYRVQYFVGYGVYPWWASDPTSTAPGTGLLANNGTGRTLIQLLWAGPNNRSDWYDQGNLAGGYAGGDDVVLESRIVQAGFVGYPAGFAGYDEWLHTSLLPPPYTTTNSLHKPVFMRIYEDDSPAYGDRYSDSELVWPAESDPSGPPKQAFTTILTFETGNETVPTEGVMLFEEGPIEPGPLPDPVQLPSTLIQPVEFDPEVVGYTIAVPTGYSLTAVHGADTMLPNGVWDWKLLDEGTDYTVTNGVVTLLTTGDSIPSLRVVLLGLVYSP